MVTKSDKIFVAGHRGMVGTAILNSLIAADFANIVTRKHDELDLTQQDQVRRFFLSERPDYVVIAAAKVGGIGANNNLPAEFIYQNIMIEANIIHEAWSAGTKGLLFLGSSCIYPKLAPQPMKETALLTGPLEPTNEPYAIAKIAGIKMCESYNRQYGTDYRSVMPTNLYGPHDNFNLENSHVIPALLRRFHRAAENSDKNIEVWGTGNARREFLHVEDMASACLHVMQLEKPLYDELTEPMCSHINIGSGADVTISELAHTIKKVTGFTGNIKFDQSKPDGAPRKLMDSSLLENSGWRTKFDLASGLQDTYQWYLHNQGKFRQ